MWQLLLDARWSEVQVNGRPLQARDLIKIPEQSNFYTKPSGQLVVVVEDTAPRIGITDSGKRPMDQQKYTCELCAEVGDGHFMRQHMAGHDQEESWNKYRNRWTLPKPEFPCGLCMVRTSGGCAPPGNAADQMDYCYMNFAGKKDTAQVDHFCKLVTAERPYGTLGYAAKCRWKKKPPEPSTNRPLSCPIPGCKMVLWSRYLEKHIEKKHDGFQLTSTVQKQIESSKSLPHEEAYTRALFQARLNPLKSLCPTGMGECKKDCHG